MVAALPRPATGLVVPVDWVGRDWMHTAGWKAVPSFVIADGGVGLLNVDLNVTVQPATSGGGGGVTPPVSIAAMAFSTAMMDSYSLLLAASTAVGGDTEDRVAQMVCTFTAMARVGLPPGRTVASVPLMPGVDVAVVLAVCPSRPVARPLPPPPPPISITGSITLLNPAAGPAMQHHSADRAVLSAVYTLMALVSGCAAIALTAAAAWGLVPPAPRLWPTSPLPRPLPQPRWQEVAPWGAAAVGRCLASACFAAYQDVLGTTGRVADAIPASIAGHTLDAITNSVVYGALLAMGAGWSGQGFQPRTRWRQLTLIAIALSLYVVNNVMAAVCRAEDEPAYVAVGWTTQACSSLTFPGDTYKVALVLFTVLAVNFRLGAALVASMEPEWAPSTPVHYDEVRRFSGIRTWLLMALGLVPTIMLLRAAAIMGKDALWLERLLVDGVQLGLVCHAAWYSLHPAGWHYAAFEASVAAAKAAVIDEDGDGDEPIREGDGGGRDGGLGHLPWQSAPPSTTTLHAVGDDAGVAWVVDPGPGR